MSAIFELLRWAAARGYDINAAVDEIGCVEFREVVPFAEPDTEPVTREEMSGQGLT